MTQSGKGLNCIHASILYDFRSLELTIQCTAFNTSNCNTEEDSLQMVMGALDTLRVTAGYRCPWLTPDLCTRTPPCPAQFVGCDIQLQINLMNNPLDDVCLYVDLVIIEF